MKSLRRVAVLPLLFMAIGGLCMIGGIMLLALRLTNPERAAQVLPATPLPPAPTEGFLLKTALPPPPRPTDGNIPIMPVMAVAQDTPYPSQTPSPTFDRCDPFCRDDLTETLPAASYDSPSPSPTASMTPTLRLALGTPIPFITPTPTATRIPRQPTRLLIPSIGLDAPVQKVWLQQVLVDGQVLSQWRVPEGRIVGWHETSAPLGQVGNTVLNGHHNINGHVFRDLIKVQPGDTLRLEAADSFGLDYTVVQTMLLPEEGRSLEERLENARWLLPSSDERITLVTCWPPDGRSHRLVVVALPSATLSSEQTRGN